MGASDGPEKDNNKKRMEENKLKNVKFDLFLFWNLESFENWMERTLLSKTAVLTLSKTKLHFYRTDDATAHPSYGQQINGDWKDISRFDSWPVGHRKTGKHVNPTKEVSSAGLGGSRKRNSAY